MNAEDWNLIAASLNFAKLCLPAFQDHLRYQGHSDLAEYASEIKLDLSRQDALDLSRQDATQCETQAMKCDFCTQEATIHTVDDANYCDKCGKVNIVYCYGCKVPMAYTVTVYYGEDGNARCQLCDQDFES